jgi:hypothetical protein
MVERRIQIDRRRRSRSGRRATDPSPTDIASVDIGREITLLRQVIERLIDAVQTLTAKYTKQE